MATARDITQLFLAASEGDQAAFDEVVARVYDELVAMAERQMRQRFGRLDGLTLEPTALVNETLLKLLGNRPSFANRRHFFSFATQVMKRALVDYQRSRVRAKRGGGLVRVTLTDIEGRLPGPPEANPTDVIEALGHLETLDARKGEVANLRVFWGLEMPEIAATLDVSLSTVERDWRFSRAWLARELTAG